MRKTFLVIFLAACLLLFSVSSAGAAEYIRVATAGAGGNYYRLGAAMTSLWNELYDDILLSTIQATQGSPHNCDLLADGEVEIAFLAGSIASDALHNRGGFADRPEGRYDNMRFINFLYPNPQWFLAMEWAPDIESVRDLKGKRISVGMLGSHGENTWRRVMEYLGWTYDDVREEFTVHGTAIDQVRNRMIDAVLWPDAPGSPSMTEIMQTGYARALSYEEDLIEYIVEGTEDIPYTVPAGTVEGLEEPFETWASTAILMAREDVSEDIIYKLTKAMFENIDYLVSIFPLASFIKIDEAYFGQVGSLHPGAARYYEEVGVLDRFN